MPFVRNSPSGPELEVLGPVPSDPNTLVGNPTPAPELPVDIPVPPNTVVGRVGGNITAAQLVAAQVALNEITNALLAQMAALSVKANPTGALGNAQDVQASADDTVFRRVAGALDFGPLTPGMLPAGLIPLTALAPIGANTVVANATAGAASPTAFPVATNTVLGRVGANIVAAQLVTTQIALNQVTNAILAMMAANTVKANPSGGLADAQDFAIGPNSVLGRAGGDLIAAQIVTSQVALNQITNALLAQMAANTVKVNATAGLADAQDLPIGLNTVLGRVAGNIVAAQIVTAQIALNQVTNALLAQMAALTVKANPTNAVGSAQDVQATTDDTVFRRTGATLNFGLLTAGMFPAVLTMPGAFTLETAAGTLTLSALAGNLAMTASGSAQLIAAGLAELASTAGTARVRSITADLILSAATTVALAAGTALGLTAGTTIEFVTAAVSRWIIEANGSWNIGGSNGAIGQTIVSAGGAAPPAWGNLPLSGLATQAANTIVANATAGIASPTAFPVGINTVLGRVAGNIVAAQLVTGQIADDQVTFAKLQDIGYGIVGNPTFATTATPSLITPPGSFAVLYDNGAGALVFALLVTGNYSDGSVTLPKLATQAANTVVANATAGVASPTAVAVGTNTVLGRVAGNIVAAQAVNAQIVGGALGTAKGVALGGIAGTLQDLTGLQLGQQARFGGFEVQTLAPGTYNNFAVLATTSILFVVPNAAGDVIFTGFALGSSNLGGRLKICKATATGRVIINHDGGTSSVVNRVFTPGAIAYVLSANQDGCTISHDDDAANGPWRIDDRIVPTDGLATMAANTILANATAASASPTAVPVNTNTIVGRQSANIVDITVSTNSVVGRAGAGTDVTAITFGTNTVLGRAAGNLVAAQIVTGQVANNQITNALLAQMAANTVKANPTNALANAQDVAIGTNTVLGRRGGDIVAAQIVPNQLAPESASIAVPFTIRAAFAAGPGGAPDDVIIFNANSPFNFLFADCFAVVGTGAAAGTLTVRSATGGGGVALSSALAAAVPGTSRNNNTAVPVILAGSTVVVRRSDSGIAGTVVIMGIP